jgi:SAM-dependent methyltransferase
MTDANQRSARSFGSVAENYDRYRPSYAPAAVDWALGERPLRVADVGAGTGILSRLLRQLGHQVVAVEPDGAMRAQLTRVSDGVTALDGTAEDIPLPDGSVDAVVAGQAYHWFDPDRAHPEIARVLRPGGVFAAFWNDADPGTQWTVRLDEIVDGMRTTVDHEPAPHFGEWFGPVTEAEFRHEMVVTPDEVVATVMTRSPYLVGTPEDQRALVAAVRDLLAGPELAGRDRFPMPYLTRVHRAIVHRT